MTFHTLEELANAIDPDIKYKGDAMGSFEDFFNSEKAMKAADIEEPFVATISSISEIEFKEGERGLMCHFSDHTRPISLNRTRCESIADIAGTKDMSEWEGTKIEVFQGETRYQGKKVPCIAIRHPQKELAAEEIPF